MYSAYDVAGAKAFDLLPPMPPKEFPKRWHIVLNLHEDGALSKEFSEWIRSREEELVYSKLEPSLNRADPLLGDFFCVTVGVHWEGC